MDEKSYEMVTNKLINDLKFNVEYMTHKAGKNYVYAHKMVCCELLDLLAHFASYCKPQKEEEDAE